MNKTEFIQIIREVVKKEVRSALREELQRQPLQEVKKPLSNVLGTTPKFKKPISTGNVLEDLINETAQSDWRSMGNFTAADAMNFQSIHNQSPETNSGNIKPSSIESMLNNAPKVASPEMISSVAEVPDFSAMMNTMKTKGML
jgi:hypothetical protein